MTTLLSYTPTSQPAFQPAYVGSQEEQSNLQLDGRKPFQIAQQPILVDMFAIGFDTAVPRQQVYQGSIRLDGGYGQIVSGVNTSSVYGKPNEPMLFLKVYRMEDGVIKPVYAPIWRLSESRDFSAEDRNTFLISMAQSLTRDDKVYLYSTAGPKAVRNARPQERQADPNEVTITLANGATKTVVPSNLYKSSFYVEIPNSGTPAKRIPIYEFTNDSIRYYVVRHPTTQKLVVVYAARVNADVSLDDMEPKILALYGIKTGRSFSDTGRKLTVNPNGGPSIEVTIYKATDQNFDYYAVPLPGSPGKFAPAWKYAKGTKYETISADINQYIRQLYKDPSSSPQSSIGSSTPRLDTFKAIPTVSNTLTLSKTDTDFGVEANYVPGAISFNVVINGKQEIHRGTVGLVKLGDGRQVLAVSINIGQGKTQLVVLENVKYDPNKPHDVANNVALQLSQRHANGKFAVNSASRTGFADTPAEAVARQKAIEDGVNVLLTAADVAFLFTAAKGLWTAARTYFRFNTMLKAGQVLTAAQLAEKKAAEAVLVGYGIGAVAGGSSYGLFVKRKYWDELTAAIAAGKPVEALSSGAKALLQLTNWTLGTGRTSADVALWNVGVGKNLATQNLSGTANLLQKGWNWGMFVDVRSFTNKNIIAVFGQQTGNAMIQKYGPVLRWMTNPANKPLDATGKLIIPTEVLQQAGFANNAALVEDMMKSGFWRVFSSAPVLGTALRVAWTSSASGTASSYMQLGLTRAGAGMLTNAFWQSVNGMVLNKEININYVQLSGSFGSGIFRSWGAPGAWLAEIGGRFASYGLSSTAAFFVSLGWREFWNMRGAKNPAEKDPTNVTFTPFQLQILSRANTAMNAARLLMEALDKHPSASVEDKKLLAQYVNLLTELSLAGKDTLAAKAKALDAWLDGKQIGNLSRRQVLNNFRLEWLPGLDTAVKLAIQRGDIVNSTFTGSFRDLGITSQFSKNAPLAAQNK
jgi:hypothetical protein